MQGERARVVAVAELRQKTCTTQSRNPKSDPVSVCGGVHAVVAVATGNNSVRRGFGVDSVVCDSDGRNKEKVMKKFIYVWSV
ncbi:hypothetical protein DEO72_LG9g1380 [Vigna unguiculata]|uniref:Uncharacterized protein n=1 Tax=Vigna unguiculata TaxID=3917 RepID=A0A4D6MZA0_VIGUN|nr:hypothetical protein DEO72_LG9g1380 [Vigna unguiculata]